MYAVDYGSLTWVLSRKVVPLRQSHCAVTWAKVSSFGSSRMSFFRWPYNDRPTKLSVASPRAVMELYANPEHLGCSDIPFAHGVYHSADGCFEM